MFDNQLLNNNEKSRVINLFWIGFIIYTIGYFFGISFKVSPYFRAIIQILGLLIFMRAAFNLVQFRIENIYLKVAFSLYCLWLLSVIARGFLFERKFLQSMIFDPFEGVFLYFVPLIVLFHKSLYFYKKMFDTISILSIFFIINSLIFFKTLINPDILDLSAQSALEYSAKALSIPCGFLLLTYNYHSNRRKMLAFLGIILTLLFSIIKARRGLVFMATFTLIASIILSIFALPRKKSNILGLFLILIVLFSIIYMYIISIKDGDYGMFDSIIKRSGEDTRSEAVLYFVNDMNYKDWIIGKGINGQYFSPTEDGYYRSGIESDYLNIILKGGIVSLGLQLLILFPASYKGIFKSKNMLSKAAGVWILFYLVCLYPSPNTKFTLFYLIVWAAVGICYSKRILEMSDSSVSEYFRS
jgi:hypothetical protein